MLKCEYCYKSKSWREYVILLAVIVLVIVAIEVIFVSCSSNSAETTRLLGGYTTIGTVENEYSTSAIYYVYSDVTHLVYIYYGHYPSMCPVYKTATEVYTYEEFLKDHPQYETNQQR